MMKSLKDMVYKYIKEHEFTSPNEIQNALNIEDGLSVLTVLEELRKDGFIILKPFPLNSNNSSSVHYATSDKKYSVE